MRLRQAYLKISTRQGEKRYALNPNRPNSFDELYVDFQWQKEGEGHRYTLFLHPKEDLVLLDLAVEFDDIPVAPGTRFMANGFQSWSESRPLPLDVEIPRLRRAARPFMGRYGDEYRDDFPRGRGKLHSWTYTYLEDSTGAVAFLGSLGEQTGFTLFLLDREQGVLTVRKDLRGLSLSHSFPGLDFWVGQGRAPEIFNAYFALARQFFPGWGKPAVPHTPGLGWTSWYRYFTDISEEIILANLEQVAASDLPFQYVQIDDGWQTAVGDWRSVKPAFSNGLAQLAKAIRTRNLTPGLWLAPFIASAKSDLARRHPEWLLKDDRGKPLRAGWNPYWGGWFYALDFYHPGVQDYLSGVFHVVLDQWGFGLLKLDFLFAVCLAPPPGKTRGQVMWEAMDFLRRQLGDRQMLACGVPLGSAFGLADICRVGGDVHLAWEHPLLAFLRHRERVSTLASLRATLGRWALNGRAFRSDPDVFMLRQENQRLTPVQQHTLLTINALLGGLLFTSDDVGAYSPEQRGELEEALYWQGSTVLSVQETGPDLFRIDFECEGSRYFACCNLSGRPAGPLAIKNDRIQIRPFETIILKG